MTCTYALPPPIVELVSSISSKSNDDFAELAAILEIPVDFHHVVELESAIDDRLERATREPLGDVVHSGRPAFRVAYHQSDAVSLDRGHLPDHLQHGDRGVILAQCAVDVDDALKGQRGDKLGKVQAAYRIEGNTSAISVRNAHHLGKHVLLLRYDDVRCASLVQLLGLLGRAGQRDGDRAGVI